MFRKLLKPRTARSFPEKRLKAATGPALHQLKDPSRVLRERDRGIIATRDTAEARRGEARRGEARRGLTALTSARHPGLAAEGWGGSLLQPEPVTSAFACLSPCRASRLSCLSGAVRGAVFSAAAARVNGTCCCKRGSDACPRHAPPRHEALRSAVRLLDATTLGLMKARASETCVGASAP
ncbi:hypothetical protein SKAU_G00198810 [Synaphobranchus kaupii]|uniref:Uncharacterized protein n=1 Tax=Synaphobranchus kaupii TaxID=118154 RepID=A0A9Q1FF40_SYNKA|nr:hypothetical protein SKAU_G00198810 [Synaphobranchus kaupii]